jgi:hypothetical protein
LLADELIAAEEGPNSTQHSDGNGEPQGDDAQSRSGQAGERHEDPQEAVGEPEDEGERLRVAGCEGADEQRDIDT